MSSVQSDLPSPTTSFSSKTVSPKASWKRPEGKKRSFRHEPYVVGNIIVPSCDDDLAMRVVYGQRSSSYAASVVSGGDSVTLLSPLQPTTMTPVRAAQRTLTSPSTESLDSRRTHTQPSVEMCDLSLPNLPSVQVGVAVPPAAMTPTRECATVGSTVTVAFKYGNGKYMAKVPVCVGDLVIVEGDRGIDLGLVIGLCARVTAADTPLPCVLRYPSAEEINAHLARFQKECDSLKLLRDLCHENASELNFGAEAIRDVMLQLDGKKVTVIVVRESSRLFFDFKRLQRRVFDLFRCRVWFSYLDEIEQTMTTNNRKPLQSKAGAGGRKGGKASHAGAAASRAANGFQPRGGCTISVC